MSRKIEAQGRFNSAFIAFALLLCCSKGNQAPSVTIDGSSTVFPITDGVAYQFQKRNPVKIDVKIPVGISGTGGGFRKVCERE